MSDPNTPSLREELEMRVIALLTGEISEVDADELEKILAVDEELSAFRDRMATLMDNIHTARDEIAPPPASQVMKLSEERRRAIFGDLEPVESVSKKDEKKWWHLGLLEIAAILLLGGLLAAIMIPSVGKVRGRAQVASEREFMVVAEMDRQFAASEMRKSDSELSVPMEAETNGLDLQLELSNSLRPAPVQAAPVVTLNAPLPSMSPPNRRQQKQLSDLDIAEEVPVLGDITATGRLFSNTEVDSIVVAESKDALSNNLSSVRGIGGHRSPSLQAKAADNDERLSMNAFGLEDAPSYSGDKNGEGMAVAPEIHSSTVVSGYFANDEAKKNSLGGSNIEFEPHAKGLESTRELAEVTVREEEASEMRGFTGLVEYGSNVVTVDPFAAPSSRSAELPATAEVDPFGAGSAPADGYASSFGDERREFGKKSKLAKELNARSNYDMDFSDYAEAGEVAKKQGSEEFNKNKTREQMLTEVSQSWERPKVFDTSSEKLKSNRGRSSRLKDIVIPQVNFSGMPMSQVVETLEELSVEYDPEKRGVNLDYLQSDDGADPRVNIALRNLSLDRVLQFVTQQVNHSYDIGEDRISIRPDVKLSNAELAAIARNELVSQAPKPEKQTAQAPVSTFSLNVSDVSFELAQAALASQRIPSAELIRTEEFVNGFTYGDPAPREDEPVSLNWEIAQHPYQHNRQIVRFSLQTQAAGRNAGQPLNLNLLVDNSGSMQRPDRRAILEKSLEALQSKLTDRDQLNVVLFARQPKLIANAANVIDQKQAIVDTLNYKPEGGTNLESGLEVAYSVAQQNYDPAASNRVILMTDGAANLGEVNASNLAQTVIDNRKQGIALDAYGIGWEDYNDALLEEITRNGDGRYAFLNDVESASEDFAEKLAGTLRVSAADVKVQILWNPERVKTYRQIGYDLHQLKEQDFRDNSVDAAEIGEAESGTALYVLQVDEDPDIVGGLGTLQVRYRVPATGEYVERAWQLEMPHNVPSLKDAEPSLRLAASSALFAERLANNPFASSYSFEDLEDLTRDLPEAFPTQPRVVELQNMIQSAHSLFTHIE